MEYFDWVDRSDRVIGVTTRQDAHQKRLYHRAVHLYCRGNSNGLILQKRSHAKDVEPGLWTVGCSGHVDRGESYEQAAVRELQEELNVTIELSQLTELLRSDPSHENGYEFVCSFEIQVPIQAVLNPKEILELRELSLLEVEKWIFQEPENFSCSFRHLFPLVKKRLQQIT